MTLGEPDFEAMGTDLANHLTSVMVMLSAGLEPIKEATQGYREQMKALGFEDDPAQQMAVQYHGVLMAILNNSTFSGKK